LLISSPDISSLKAIPFSQYKIVYTFDFTKQVHLIETFKGAGFLSAVSLMGKIGDFSAFSKPKQLFAYFGLDPTVKQPGKFEGTKNKMSKRGSSIARRVIHTLALQSISTSRTGGAKNPVLRDYYLEKCKSKPKLVAMGAVSHKVCNKFYLLTFISWTSTLFIKSSVCSLRISSINLPILSARSLSAFCFFLYRHHHSFFNTYHPYVKNLLCFLPSHKHQSMSKLIHSYKFLPT